MTENRKKVQKPPMGHRPKPPWDIEKKDTKPDVWDKVKDTKPDVWDKVKKDKNPP